MSVTPHQDDDQSPAVRPADPALEDILRFLKASKRQRNRRLALFALVGIAFVSPIVVFIQRNDNQLAATGQPAAPRVTQSDSKPVSPHPSPRAIDTPSSPRPTLGETPAGRDREHSMTARDTARRPATVTGPAAQLPPETSRRCSALLERASLGEILTDDERTFLRTDCR
jgi:hypothetical protein